MDKEKLMFGPNVKFVRCWRLWWTIHRLESKLRGIKHEGKKIGNPTFNLNQLKAESRLDIARTFAREKRPFIYVIRRSGMTLKCPRKCGSYNWFAGFFLLVGLKARGLTLRNIEVFDIPVIDWHYIRDHRIYPTTKDTAETAAEIVRIKEFIKTKMLPYMKPH